jgi:non-ribosomal peptide synthetase component E (peptide arylation enzyme)
MGGAGICSGWGLTEAPNLTMVSIHDPAAKKAESEGRPALPEVDLRAVKSDGGLAGPGESGELRVRAPQVCRGYLDSSLDAAAFDEHGYFRTGDLGCIDAEGYVVITGRRKDVIIRKGENIPAKEVEDLLYTHPKVAEVAVVGLPDPKTGERCCAVVVARDANQPLELAELQRFLREQQLMVQKIPEQLELVDALPRNATGKILKHELRARFTQGR